MYIMYMNGLCARMCVYALSVYLVQVDIRRGQWIPSNWS